MSILAKIAEIEAEVWFGFVTYALLYFINSTFNWLNFFIMLLYFT